MSDPTPESAPVQSNHDIVANTLANLEAESGGGEPSAPDPIATETPTSDPIATAAPTQQELSAAAKFLVSKGHKPGMREDNKSYYTRLPFPAIETMLKEYAESHSSTWTSEKTALEKARDEYKAHLDEMYADIKGDPRALVEKIAAIDPRYRALLEPPKQDQPHVEMKLPDPDAEWNGAKTWSMEAFQKSVIPYIVEQAKAQAKAEAEGVLKPYKEREERDKAVSSLRERTQQQIAEAQSWPGWKDHEAEILKALREDSETAAKENRRPSLSLEGAYRQVVMGKMTADRQKLREELLAEINATAKTTPTVTNGGPAPMTPGKPLSNRDIVAKTLANLQKQGA